VASENSNDEDDPDRYTPIHGIPLPKKGQPLPSIYKVRNFSGDAWESVKHLSNKVGAMKIVLSAAVGIFLAGGSAMIALSRLATKDDIAKHAAQQHPLTPEQLQALEQERQHHIAEEASRARLEQRVEDFYELLGDVDRTQRSVARHVGVHPTIPAPSRIHQWGPAPSPPKEPAP
jgi:hypothetical protein